MSILLTVKTKGGQHTARRLDLTRQTKIAGPQLTFFCLQINCAKYLFLFRNEFAVMYIFLLFLSKVFQKYYGTRRNFFSKSGPPTKEVAHPWSRK